MNYETIGDLNPRLICVSSDKEVYATDYVGRNSQAGYFMFYGTLKDIREVSSHEGELIGRIRTRSKRIATKIVNGAILVVENSSIAKHNYPARGCNNPVVYYSGMSEDEVLQLKLKVLDEPYMLQTEETK